MFQGRRTVLRREAGNCLAADRSWFVEIRSQAKKVDEWEKRLGRVCAWLYLLPLW